MPVILSATEVTVFSNISISAQTILDKKLIETIEYRLPMMLNNYFTSDGVQVQTTAAFYPTANTIMINQNSWSTFGFKDGDPIYIYSSYRNDKYCKIDSFVNNLAYVNTAYSVVDESFPTNLGKVITFVLVYFPIDVKMVAAEMIAFDYDVRSETSPNVKSNSFGPFSESYTTDSDWWGYPKNIIDKLERYKLCRLN